jgi:hypothetical protein
VKEVVENDSMSTRPVVLEINRTSHNLGPGSLEFRRKMQLPFSGYRGACNGQLPASLATDTAHSRGHMRAVEGAMNPQPGRWGAHTICRPEATIPIARLGRITEKRRLFSPRNYITQFPCNTGALETKHQHELHTPLCAS